MFRRDADVLKAYTNNKPEACAAMQSDILRRAADMVKNRGRLVYSTCTFNTIENEQVIEKFLTSRADYKLTESKRYWPHKDVGEGHFLAVLERTTQAGGGGKPPLQTAGKKPSALSCTPFSDFCRDYLFFPTFPTFSVLHGNMLYLQSESLQLNGLRVARSGWHVGEISKGRFVPSQALAMGLCMEDARYAANLQDADAWRYVKGESLDYDEKTFPSENKKHPKEKPWVLVCHNSHPIGWARLVQGRLKNHLPVFIKLLYPRLLIGVHGYELFNR
jgi:NOL1/NOP2/fmu family ribosome biogenesis protein